MKKNIILYITNSISELTKKRHFNVLKILSLLIALITSTGCVNNEQRVTDIDGNQYSIKDYQGVWWMTENLKVTRDRNGKNIRYYNPDNDPMMKDEFG